MAMNERDKYTGHMTTGHDWNGIKELNTKVPKPVWFFLVVTFLFSVIYWLLFPAWPLGVTYTKGLLGTDQHQRVDRLVEKAIIDRSVWTDRILELDYADIQNDPALMQIVSDNGGRLFRDNCSVCHGNMGKGGPGFPALTGTSWLWGGTPDAIFETIRVGVNSDHEESRLSEMMAFGRDQMLSRDEILAVTDYVLSLSDGTARAAAVSEDPTSGATIFMDNCASCHGENAKGNIDVGAPDLTDNYWIYGGGRDGVFNTVWNGHKGYMPAWQGRLPTVDRKILTLYLMDLANIKAE